MFGLLSNFGAENVFQSSTIKVITDGKYYLVGVFIGTVGTITEILIIIRKFNIKYREYGNKTSN